MTRLLFKAFAPAKINLSLHVTGLRGDGYHILDSLVVFADIGDTLKLSKAVVTSLQVTGPFAQGVPTDHTNLVWRVLARFFPDKVFALHLEKNLPHSAGLGGGTSDAAAALRAVCHAMDQSFPSVDALVELGADLPVCMVPKPQRMMGIGADLCDSPALPDMAVLLLNTGVKLSTGEVFKALRRKGNPPMHDLPKHANFEEFCVWLNQHRNDLEAPARLIAPEIGLALQALENAGAAVARMSGSGSSCFGLYPTLAAAQTAAKHIRHKDWWTKAAHILSG